VPDIYIGGIGCDCCGGCISTEICPDCFVTGPYKLILTRILYDPGGDCLPIDWSPTDQCTPLCGDGTNVVGDGPGGTITSGGQTFTLTWGAAIVCLSTNRLSLVFSLTLTPTGCSGTPYSVAFSALYISDAGVCDVSAMLGDYDTGPVKLTFATGAC
jgi:hypothetical protein